MSTKRPESVLVLVTSADGLVLLLERSDWPGFWQSVTGALEEYEAPWDAAVRELKEETNLPADGLVDCQYTNWYSIYKQFRPKYAPGVKENLEHCFHLTLPKAIEIQLSHEHTRYQWLTAQEAAELAYSPSNQAAIKKWAPVTSPVSKG